MVPELEENRAAAGGLKEGDTGESIDPGGAPSDGECKAALDGVEVCTFGEGELKLVTERSAGGRIEQGGGAGLLAGLLHLEALIRRQVGVGVQGGVDRVRKESVKLVVHHPALLPSEVDDR
jgi:hypothetical protein